MRSITKTLMEVNGGNMTHPKTSYGLAHWYDSDGYKISKDHFDKIHA